MDAPCQFPQSQMRRRENGAKVQLTPFIRSVILVAFTMAVTLVGQVSKAESDGAAVILSVQFEDGSNRVMREFTLDELLEMPQGQFQTHTVWTEGLQSFEGVWLSDLLAELEAQPSTLELIALNEYMVELSPRDMFNSKALIAIKHNGALMSQRQKGPLWLVYPYDEGADYQTELVYMSSIWQLRDIVVLP